MDNEKAEDIRMGASYCTSLYEYESDQRRWEHYAEVSLRMQIVNLIQIERSEVIRTDNRVEKRIDMYVASPELFWKTVRIEAEKIAFRFGCSDPLIKEKENER